MIVGEMIRDLREDRNYTQKEFAQMLNITPGCLSKYETGRSQPSLQLLIQIADKLDVSIDYLIGRDGCKVEYNALKKDYVKLISGFDILNLILSLDPKRRRLLVEIAHNLKRCSDLDKIK